MSPKILKIYVEKGLSVEVAEGKWRRQSYGVEADVSMLESEEDLNKSRQALENKVEDWLQLGEGAVTEKEVADIPDIDPAELNELPWTKYAGNPGEWIKNPAEFTSFECDNMNTLLILVKALTKVGKTMKEQKLTIGDKTYSFSGKDKETGKPRPMFVTRFPAKKEKAK